MSSSLVPGRRVRGRTAHLVFGSNGPLDVLKFSGTDIKQGDDAVRVDTQAIGNEIVIGSEGSQAMTGSMSPWPPSTTSPPRSQSPPSPASCSTC